MASRMHVASIMSKGNPHDILKFMQQHNSSHDILVYLFNINRIHTLRNIITLTPMFPFFLRPRCDMEEVVFKQLAKISPIHHKFFTCWAAYHAKMDMRQLHTKKKTSFTTAVGKYNVFVKIANLPPPNKEKPNEEPYERIVAKNEDRFSRACTVLSLANLSFGLPPFSYTLNTKNRMYSTTVSCGKTLYKDRIALKDVFPQIVLALWSLRLRNLVHYDLHLRNVVTEKIPSTEVFYAWLFRNGFDTPVMRNPSDIIEGFCMTTKNRVCLIDGGLSMPVDQDRETLTNHLLDDNRNCDWYDIDTSQSPQEIGQEIFERVTDLGENGKRKFIPIVLYSDIPNSAVDLVSLCVCLTFAGYDKDIVNTALGHVYTLSRNDESFGFESYIQLLLFFESVFESFNVVHRPRRNTDFVITLPQPGPDVDDLLDKFESAVYL